MEFRAWQRAVGPGLIFSGSAIGVSHLVQSTRAGAMFGLALMGVIVLINLLKYPTFRFGLDYAHTTGKTLIGGYRELGAWAVPLYAVVFLTIAPIGLAAITVTTAAILAALTGADLSIMALSGLATVATVILLLVGGYGWLDRVNKLLIAFLTLATISAAAMALPRVEWGSIGNLGWSVDPMALLFVVALAGFMPSAISQSVQISLWTLKSQEEVAESERLSMRQMRGGFMFAYLLTVFLALCFCIMGAGVMHAQDIVPETGAASLAAQIIGLYRETLGPVPATLAAISALCVMATTMITATDGAARGFGAVFEEYRGNVGGRASQRVYAIFLLLLAVLSVVVLALMMDSFSAFIDIVTSIYFVSSPLVALLNYLVVTRCEMPEEHRPSSGMRALSLIGIALMTAMAVMFFLLKAA